MPLLSERRLGRINRAVASGRIIPYLAVFILSVILAAAAVVRVFAQNEFETYGESVWWAAQTITTVGYGDVIPQNSFSRVVAVAVMLFGIAIVSIVTAVVTSAVMAASQGQLAEDATEEQLSALRRIEDRLASLEERLQA
jgi:voltage-gated potassium channel